MYKQIILILILGWSALLAQDLMIAAGAGYKKPMMEIINNYKRAGHRVDAIFGNMGQISNQARESDIALLIGDKKFLEKKSRLKFQEYLLVGVGKVVLAYSKQVTLKNPYHLANSHIKKIAMPQPKKAIYGIAGQEFLDHTQQYKSIKEKLFVVATVPQVMSYVARSEVDVGIVNLTAALAFQHKIGGYIIVNQKDYTKIEIVAGVLKGRKSKACRDFLSYLQTPESKAVFRKYGL
ncbi:molybdate ABC transporter substrate-binding protein [Sulfurospirillum sp. 1612]|uniref:molybdate ABC transporter substrate-binding protein n=1 Tax=Sulfurospirillum sp. 1612 TaxID=3094835 RepID=UPI002F944684